MVISIHYLPKFCKHSGTKTKGRGEFPDFARLSTCSVCQIKAYRFKDITFFFFFPRLNSCTSSSLTFLLPHSFSSSSLSPSIPHSSFLTSSLPHLSLSFLTSHFLLHFNASIPSLTHSVPDTVHLSFSVHPVAFPYFYYYYNLKEMSIFQTNGVVFSQLDLIRTCTIEEFEAINDWLKTNSLQVKGQPINHFELDLFGKLIPMLQTPY